MATNPKALAFSHWLRARMADHDISQRALGKQLDPEQPERGRRQVVRHLSGTNYPSKASRRSYGEVFGEEFVDEDDEEESDPVSLIDELTGLVRAHRALGRKLERIASRSIA